MKVVFEIKSLLLVSSCLRCQNSGNIHSIYKGRYCKSPPYFKIGPDNPIFCVFRPKSPSCRGRGRARKTWRKTLWGGSKCWSTRWSKRGECLTSHCCFSPPTTHTNTSASLQQLQWFHVLCAPKNKFLALRDTEKGRTWLCEILILLHLHKANTLCTLDNVKKKKNTKRLLAFFRKKVPASSCLYSTRTSLMSQLVSAEAVTVWACQRDSPPSPAGVMSLDKSMCWHEDFVCCRMLMTLHRPQ